MEDERAQGPVGFLLFFGFRSLAFKALLPQASAKLTGLASPTIAPRSQRSSAPQAAPFSTSLGSIRPPDL